MFDNPDGLPVQNAGVGEQEPGFGLVRADKQTKKPAYCALAATLGSPC